MTSSRRRLAAHVIAPLLVVGLAACAGAEPEAMPTPTPTPTPTVEAPPEAKPGSRVPLSCEELATVPSEFSDVAVTAVDSSLNLVLAGFTDCSIAAWVGSTPVSLDLAIVPERTGARLTYLDVNNPYEPSSMGFAGPESGAACGVFGDLGTCESVALAMHYTIVVLLRTESDVASAEPLLSALASFQISLVAALDAAGEPLPEWDAGPELLRYPRDCETEMRDVDQHIIDALPFTSLAAVGVGSGDGAPIYFEAERRAGTSGCEWMASVDSGSSGIVTLVVYPGASFAIDDGRFRPQGDEIVVSGADRAWQSLDDYGIYTVTFVVDRSIAVVSYSPDYRGSDPDPEASVRAITAAVIADGPRV